MAAVIGEPVFSPSRCVDLGEPYVHGHNASCLPLLLWFSPRRSPAPREEGVENEQLVNMNCVDGLSLSLCPPPGSPLRWWNNGFRGQVGERRELLRRVFLCNVCSPPGDERGDAIDGQWNKWTFCVHLRRPKKRNTEILEPGREKTN